jgi:hypothetical protein
VRLIQFTDREGARKVAIVNGAQAEVLVQVSRMRELALLAIRSGNSLERQAQLLNGKQREDYAAILKEQRILAPLDHEDPAHCLVAGAGLTHLSAASTRDKMHQKLENGESARTDTMHLFQWGLDRGRPGPGQVGVQSEWFYKGDGDCVVAPGQAFPSPDFAEDGGEEPELAGLYVIADDGVPHRLGFALGNEFSDHVMERKNYLYQAHSKLRPCSFGPELLIGPLPSHLVGMSRIRREGRVIWEQEFLSGQDNMSHQIENLEYHHFKYDRFLRPGDVHVYFLGAANLSFAYSVRTRVGDSFEISVPEFGEPLVNGISAAQSRVGIGGVKML